MRPLVLCLILFLAACAPRGHLVTAPKGFRAPNTEAVWTASQRTTDGRPVSPVWFSRIDIAVPPPDDGLAQSITFANGEVLVTGGGRFAGPDAFRQAMERDLARRAPGDRDIVLFIHGYNYSFAEGVARNAQLARALQLPGIHAHFSWPSRMKPYAYSGDRDAALLSRDGLVETLELLSSVRGRGRIVLMGHSMGAQLLMEGLRQMAISGRRDLIAEIDGVMLISPDIDLQLFRSQAHAVGPLPQPFVIMTSARDRALQLSALLSNEPLRLGNIPDARPVADLDVIVVDTGAFSTGIGHFNIADSAALQQIVAGMSDVDRILPEQGGTHPGLIGGAVSRVEQAVQVVLSPAF